LYDAAEANNVVETQLFGNESIELLVGEPPVGHDRDLHPIGDNLRKVNEKIIFVVIVLVLQRGLLNGLPHQRHSRTVGCLNAQHQHAVATAVEVGPIEIPPDFTGLTKR
jgi:hypothetical protein